MIQAVFAAMSDGFGRLAGFWGNQLGGTFLGRGSTLAIDGLICTLLLAAFLAVPRGRCRLPRLRVWWRALFPRRLFRSASGRADIAYFLFGLFFYGLAFGWMLFSAGPLAGWVADGLTLVLGPAPAIAVPVLVQGVVLTILFFLAYEFAYWLDHFLSHKVPVLWQFHRVHHGAESLSLLTNFRVHPVDTLVFMHITAAVLGLSQGIARYTLGPTAHPWEIGGTNALIILTAVTLTHLQHSHLWITFGPTWGRWVLSPAHHQVHHSTDERHFDRNFGSTLALWDRLFGTFYLPSEKREARHFGLDDNPSPHGLRAAFVTPFERTLALLPLGRRAKVEEAVDTQPEMMLGSERASAISQ
jgi:sterol desaturase/sphingolipid hydroxylase (fatty acid hydroxylase superfamily)